MNTPSSYSIRPTKLDGVLLLDPPFAFEDYRGANIETFHQRELNNAGVDVQFIRDSLSISRKSVLRGLHGDTMTWKLISCLAGELFLVVVNMDLHSPQYLRWEGFTLSQANRLQVLVPPNFANGHLILSESAHFFYKMSHDHNRANQFTVAWNDPSLGISWPVSDPIVSDRDAGKDPTAPVVTLPAKKTKDQI